MQKTFTLGKYKRLKSLVRIENLFKERKTFMVFPLLVYYTVNSKYDNTNEQMMVSVSKRLFKHAVKRNRVKRLIREAYRVNLPLINNPHHKIFSIAFVYKGKEIYNYATIFSAMQLVVNKMSAILTDNN